MFGAVSSASRLKPDILLAQAVSQFESDLSSKQKATFRTYRTQALDSPPDPSDVMRLTAEMDCHASRNGRRCIGPRLTNFLQAVQKFAALGDIMVGGSQNLIACGVWSLVRLSLLSIISFSTYLENLSSLLMAAGRSAPRYQEMALVYPRSKNLQSYLPEYFVVVVRLCHQILKFTQKSIFGQYTSGLSDSDMKAYQSELEISANAIKEEMNLLMAQTIEEEARENSKSRALSSKLFESASRQQKLKAKLRVLDFCSKYDYETTWKQVRKIGNTTQFSRTDEYRNWKSQEASCTLIYTGKLGSGKSVLLANLVEDLYLNAQNKNMTVAYFFCRHDILESLKPQTVIGSLARQLLSPIADFSTVAKSIDNMSTGTLNFEKILSLLQQGLLPETKAYFVIDGLDECDFTERQTLISQLRRLQQTFSLLLCVALRPGPSDVLSSSQERFTAAQVISLPDNNLDIEEFISAELERRLDSEMLVIGDPTLIFEIQDTLLKGSHGMFLWVALQIESLCNMKTDDGIREALAHLPKDLSETFARILQKPKGSGNYQRRILELVTISHRPLTLEELREALSVVPGDTDWNPSRLLNDIYFILVCCGSLIIIDEEEKTVRLVHHSFKQFLFEEFRDLANIPITIDGADKTMASIIITYLNYNIFETQLSNTVISKIPTGPMPSQIVSSTVNSAKIVQSLALKLLNSRKQSDFNMATTLINTRKLFNPYSVDKFHFYHYAKIYWFEHVHCISKQDPGMSNLLLRLLRGSKMNITIRNKSGQTLLWWALKNGHEAVIQLLLESDNVDADSRDNQYDQTPLSWAVEKGHKAAVQLLLESDKVDADSRDNNGRTPLSWAAGDGHKAIVQLLLESDKVNADSRDNNGRTPLSWAAGDGHKAIVQLLLESDKVDADSRDQYGRTPLSWAAKNGREAVVQLLLETNKVDANSRDNNDQTPLLWAAKNGYEAIVQLLTKSNKINADG